MINELELEKKEENFFEQRKPLSIIDFAGNFDDLANRSVEEKLRGAASEEYTSIDYLEKTSKSILRTIALYLKTSNPLHWFFLVFFCMVVTAILFLFDLALETGLDLRMKISTTDSSLWNMFIWVGSAVSLILLSTSVGYFISADADGSGIPEVKTVISGINIYRYFSVEAFVAKIIGLYAALVGGKNITNK
jgi:hypothetical protein